MVSRDAKFAKDEWPSKSQEPPAKIEEREKLAVPKFDLKSKEKSDSDQQGSNKRIEASLPSSSVGKSRWLTQR